jgi:hypothetical protein
MARFTCLDMLFCSFLTLALARSLQLCGLLTGYIPRCFCYPNLAVLGLLHCHGWAGGASYAIDPCVPACLNLTASCNLKNVLQSCI